MMMVYLEVTAVIPILTDDALNHFIWGLVFRIRIWSVANAVEATVVLIVAEKSSQGQRDASTL